MYYQLQDNSVSKPYPQHHVTKINGISYHVLYGELQENVITFSAKNT